MLSEPTLAHYLVLGAILFAISMAGIFLNRRNVIMHTSVTHLLQIVARTKL